MLGVLARVANDHAQPQDPSPPGALEEEPFDRAQFLAEFWQDAKTLDPDPFGGVAVLEQGIEELHGPVYRPSHGGPPQDEVVHARFDQPRLDVGPEYDLVANGVVGEGELHSLLEVYWERIQPVGRHLDPTIHTVAFLRAQSATLTTVVLLIAAQSLPVSDFANGLVQRIEAHLELLLTHTDTQGFQSVEIAQALSLLCLFVGGNYLNRTWGLTAKAVAMAVELRLDISPPPNWTLSPSPHHNASPIALSRNVQRLWMVLVDWDRACALIRGRTPMIKDPPNVNQPQLLQWCREREALRSDGVTAGYPCMLEVALRLQSNTARQLVRQSTSFDFAAHCAVVNRDLTAWRDTWFPHFSQEDQHRIGFDMEGMRLILLMMPCEYGFLRGWPPTVIAAGRDACIHTALHILTRTLPIVGGHDPVLKLTSLYTYR